MRNKTIVTISALAMVILFVLVACTAAPAAQTTKPSEDSASQATAQDPIVLVAATMYPAGNTYATIAQLYAAAVLQATEGRVKIVVNPGESLCPGAEELAAVNSGSVDAAMTVINYVVGQVPLANVGALPWVGIPDIDSNLAAAAEGLPIIQKGFEKYNIHINWYACAPSAYGLATKKEVRVPSQAKGLKIRSAGGAMDELISGWGCSTVTLPTSEMYQSIQYGVSDGTLLSVPSMVAFKLPEVAPYYCDLDIGTGGFLFYVNKDKWNRISSADQEAIAKVTPEFMKVVLQVNAANIEKGRKELPDMGENVYVPTADEMKLWKAPAQAIWDKYAASSPEAKQLTDIYRKYGAGY
ncbi:MAG: TRAP transporter substrate-binding protein DctP [Dehalococcoidia bacterium]|jgi:TRAP-type C4-dicarboxylate transport system substrate-binding protein